MDEKEKISEKKQDKEESVKLKLGISILSFLAIFIAEIYIIINVGSDVNSITLFAIMALIAAYFVIDSMIFLSESRTQRLREQYDEICNTQKASYIVLNNSFEEINERLDLLEKIMKISTEEMINAQKGTSKVIINRNKDNTEALLQSYVQLSEQLEKNEEMQTEKLAALDAISEKTISDVNKQMEVSVQQLIIQMRDLELRLSQTMMQNAKVVVSANPMEVTVNTPTKNVVKEVENSKGKTAVEEWKASEEAEIFEESQVVTEAETSKEENAVEEWNALEEVEVFEELQAVTEVENLEKEKAVEEWKDSEDVGILETLESANEIENSEEWIETLAEDNVDMKPEDVDGAVEDLIVEDAVIEPEEPQEIEVSSELQIEEPMFDIQEAEVLPELMVEEPPADESIPEDITMTEVSAEMEEIIPEEPVKEEKPPMPDLSNPNKVMSPDEIAALLANIGEEPVAEPVKEEKPPMPDLSNPNKVMSPDEIAALVANMGEEPIAELVKEEKPPMPDLSDPNKMMSPEDIAALIANL